MPTLPAPRAPHLRLVPPPTPRAAYEAASLATLVRRQTVTGEARAIADARELVRRLDERIARPGAWDDRARLRHERSHVLAKLHRLGALSPEVA